jgi:hypothetical protein
VSNRNRNKPGDLMCPKHRAEHAADFRDRIIAAGLPVPRDLDARAGESTPAPVTPDPVMREPSAPRITVADVMRDAFDAMDERNRRASTQQAIHAAERAFLAAYRAHREARAALHARGGGGERITTWSETYSALEVEMVALDAADAAKGGAK